MLCSKPVEQDQPKPTESHKTHLNVANNVNKVKGDSTKSFGIQDSEYIDLVQRLSQHLHSIADRSSPQRRHSPARSPAHAVYKASTPSEVCPNPSISTKGACQASCQASTNKRMSRRMLKSDRKLLRRSVSQRPKSNSHVQLPDYRPYATEEDGDTDTNKARVFDAVFGHKAPDRVSITPLSPRMPAHDATELFYALKTKSISRKNRASIGNVKVIRVSLPEEHDPKQQLRLIQSMRSLQALASKQQKDDMMRERFLEQAKSKSSSQSAESTMETSSAEITLTNEVGGIRVKELPPLPNEVHHSEGQNELSSAPTTNAAIAAEIKQVATSAQGEAFTDGAHRELSENVPFVTRANGFIPATKVSDIPYAVDLDRYSLPPLKNQAIARCAVRTTRKANSHPSVQTQARVVASYLSRTSKGAIFNLGPPSAPPERPLPEIPKGIPASFRKGSLCGNISHVSDAATSKNPKLSSQRAQRLSIELSKSSTRNLTNLSTSNDPKTCPTPADVFQAKLKRNARVSELKRKHLLLYNKRFATDTTVSDVKRNSIPAKSVLPTTDVEATLDLPITCSQVASSHEIPQPASPSQSTDRGSGVSIGSSRDNGSQTDTGVSVHSSSPAQRSQKSCASSSSSSSFAARASARVSTTRQTLTTSQIMTIAETNPDNSYGFQSGTLDPVASHRMSSIKDDEACDNVRVVEDVSSVRRGRSNSNLITSFPVPVQNVIVDTSHPSATVTSTIKANMGTSISRHTEQDYQDVLSSHQRLEKRLALARKELEWMGRIYPVMVSAYGRNRGGKIDHTGDEHANSLPSDITAALPQQHLAETSRSRYRITKRQQEQTPAKSTPAKVESIQEVSAKHSERAAVPNERTANACENKPLDHNDWHIFPESDPFTVKAHKLETSPKRTITRDGCTGLRKSSSTKVRVPRPSPVRNPPFKSSPPHCVMGSDERAVSTSKRGSGDASMHDKGRLLPPLKYNFSGTGRLRFDFTSLSFE